MKSKKRYISDQISNDLKRKMVFVAGPRQVGKTTLAKQFLPSSQLGYLNWDISSQRELILKHELPDSSLWVFDEIHKYRDWRNYLKGVYDEYAERHHILVTGSAQLDCYRRGGDSLQGRYHYLRLYPLSVAEVNIHDATGIRQLLELGGFPEPFYTGEAIEAKRWSRDYRHRLIEEDLVKLEQIRDLGTMELLMIRLPALVGSPLSINSLREDLGVSHATVANWLDIFTRLYAIFRIPPFGSPQLRAVKKEQKHYHFDWTLIQSPGLRFENMVAVHLLKWVHFEEDTKARSLELRYFRDVDGREVDFIVTENTIPILAVECKWADNDISKSLNYFKQRFPECQAWQITMEGQKDYLSKEGIRVTSALKFLNTLI
jgi:predicted AAA+ superfamily ATPase